MRNARGPGINVSLSRLILAETVSPLLAWGGIIVETELFGSFIRNTSKTHRESNLEKSSVVFAD